MQINHNIDHESKLLVTTCFGEVYEETLIDALQKYQKTIQNHPDYISYNEVLIFPEKIHFHLTPQGLKKLATISSSSDTIGSERKLAIIVSSNLAYSFALMYKAYRELIKHRYKKVRIFKKVKPAFNWVKENTPE